MNPKEQAHIQDDSISFIDALFFLKASGVNIVKCTLACLLAGGAYYLFVPATYKASATIKLENVQGDPFVAARAFVEKIKLPMYFSTLTQQVCGSDGELDSKIKPSVNRIAPTVSFVTHAQSRLEAKACLKAAIAEVSSNLDSVAKNLMEEKKKISQQHRERLSERLKLAKEKFQNSPALKNNFYVVEISVLLTEIIKLDREMIATPPPTVSLVSSVYAPEISTNKQPLFILGFCLSLGVILGLLVTEVMRVVPDIWQQMRKAESGAN